VSYDLFVFDPAAAPRDRAAFMEWFGEQTEWSDESADAFDPSTASSKLRRWREALLPSWPDMQDANLSEEQLDDAHVTGYSFAPGSIYLDFRWSVAEEAYDAVRSSAVEHELGFYDVSGDEGNGEIYFPGDVLRTPSGGAWRAISDQFKSLEATSEAPAKARWFDFFRRAK
jgi:hypothetical protein